MTDLQTRIMAAVPRDLYVSAAWLSVAIGASLADTQAALHDLDDEGWVIMRNGLYRLSARALAERGGK